ncbi:MAG: hypothetical protein LCH30_07930 [Proteobacteria bacterium]|nr:hypothetical protein [Pseudomonadota bacterium]
MLDESIIAHLVSIFSLTEVNRLALVEKIQLLQNELKEDDNHSNISLLETRYTLFKLEQILLSDIDNIYYDLAVFFIKRWERMKNTNAQYLHDFINPANEISTLLAQCLNETEYLSILMPSLINEEVSYLTSAYNEKDLDLKQLILTSDNLALIHIGDVLSFAHIDGQLKLNSLFNGKIKWLSFEEKQRLLSRDSSVADYYKALIDRVNYRLYGETVGAALTRLIAGLREGGRRDKGEEHNAGNAANIAIIDFKVFFDSLTEEQRKKVNATSRPNLYANENEDNEKITLESMLISLFHEKALIEYKGKQITLEHDDEKETKLTSLLDEEIETTQPLEEIDDISSENDEVEAEEEELDIAFCVELIADEIEKILKENQDLYDISPEIDFVKESLEELDRNVELYQEQYQFVISTLTEHKAYKETEPDLSLLIEEISQHPDFQLTNSEITLIVKKLFSFKFEERNFFNLTISFFNYLTLNYFDDFLVKINKNLSHEEQRFFTRNIKDEEEDDLLFPRARKARDPSTISSIDTEKDENKSPNVG